MCEYMCVYIYIYIHTYIYDITYFVVCIRALRATFISSKCEAASFAAQQRSEKSYIVLVVYVMSYHSILCYIIVCDSIV